MSVLSEARLRMLAEAALAAPSADNRHVVRLEPRGNALRLLAAPELVSATFGRRTLGLVSVGAVLESLLLRAARLGMQVETTWPASTQNNALLAELQFREGAITFDPLEEAIVGRHSNRRLFFHGPPLSEAIRNEMDAHSAAVENSALTWLDDPASRKRALRLIRAAESERFCNKELHREMFEAIRFDVGWSRTAPEGLPPGSLELPRFERPAFSLLRHWTVQRAANLLLAHRFIGLRAADLPCRFAPHVCVISAEGGPTEGAISAGRLLQRVWLHASTLNLGLQVFAASCLYAMPDCAPVSGNLRSRLASGWRDLVPRGRPYVVFRMGYADPASVRTGRPPVTSLITQY